MYPYYRSPYPAYPVRDQRFIGGWGWGLPLAIGGLGFLGGLIGGGLGGFIGGSLGARPWGFGYPGFGYPGVGYPGVGFPGYY